MKRKESPHMTEDPSRYKIEQMMGKKIRLPCYGVCACTMLSS